MIRTKSIALNSIRGFAYRQKLASGDVSIVVYENPDKQPGIASVSKKTGAPIITANTPKYFSKEVFEEAIALTNGMPYYRLGKPRIVEVIINNDDSAETESIEDAVIIDSDEYQKIVDKYTNKYGKLSYELLNKDLIKTAHRNKLVNSMIEEGATVKEIRTTVVRIKVKELTGNDKLSDQQVNKIVELLDEVYEKGVFSEFNDEIRKWLAKVKK